MDSSERAQIRLLLEHYGSEYNRLCADALKTMHADHSANGLLQSGATVKAAIRAIEAQSDAHMDRLIDAVSPVARDVEAFNLISAAMTTQVRARETELAEAIGLATGGRRGNFASVEREGERLFNEMRVRVFKRLEIQRFSFIRPTKGDLSEIRINPLSTQNSAPISAKPKNAGGMPLADHWDAMWADIAVKLWSGDLKPKTQADVKRAMFHWFNENGIEIGDTAVTQRARRLWQKIQETS